MLVGIKLTFNFINLQQRILARGHMTTEQWFSTPAAVIETGQPAGRPLPCLWAP